MPSCWILRRVVFKGMRRPAVASRAPAWRFALGVALVTVVAFLPTLRNGFVAWDDDRNFLDNPFYRGLGPSQLHWMWTTFHLGHYVPLSWMSLGLDYELWGMDARGYHLTSLLLHAANAVLLFFIARRLLARASSHPPSDARVDAASASRSIDLAAAFGALVFAVHPLRVESVAWVTERRDVLSGMFASASLLAYLRAVDGPALDRRRYGLSLAAFCCALLSKATTLTLPAVLLVLNAYPLRRLGPGTGWRSTAARRVYLELAPFAVLSAATIPLTLLALAPPDQLHFPAKIAVSAYSLAFYLWKTIVPVALSPLYPMPLSVDPTAARYVAGYLAVLAAAVVAWRARTERPSVTAAALVFLIVVFPMLGVVQNGPQIAADRYTYHSAPALAILAAAAWLLALRRRPGAATTAAAAIVVMLGALSWKQTSVWHDSETLWSYVVGRDSATAIGHTALGTLDLHAGRVDDAIAHYRRAIAVDSTYAEAHDNLGIALSQQGKFAEAVGHYRAALVYNPRNRESHNNLGIAAANLGHFDEAVAEFAEAIELDPTYADAQTNWGNALVRMGRPEEAIPHYREALRLQPANADAHHNWGVALAQEGRLADAIDQFRKALAIDPNHVEARNYLEQALRLQRDDIEDPFSTLS